MVPSKNGVKERKLKMVENFEIENDLPELVAAFSNSNLPKSQKEATQALFGVLFQLDDAKKHIGKENLPRRRFLTGSEILYKNLLRK